MFNSSAYDREETVEVMLWDWKSPVETIVVKDSDGNIVEHQIIEKGLNQYWGHDFMRLLIHAKAPAYGYSTYTIAVGDSQINPFLPTDPRLEQENRFVLENDRLKAVFHPTDATIVSLFDKLTGEEMIDSLRPTGIFRLINEDDEKGMTAWWVVRYKNVTNFTAL